MPDPLVVTSLDHLGALVAEHVMGWSRCPDGTCEGCDHRVCFFPESVGGGPGKWFAIPPNGGPARWFAEDIADAWLIVEFFVERGHPIMVRFDPHRPRLPWTAVAYGSSRGDADSAPVAICLAALAAVGHPVTLKLEESHDE